MLSQQPTLRDKFAALRQALEASAAPDWLPEAIQALILAVLARLFGQLEQMVALWQSGQLPPHAPTRARGTGNARPDSALVPGLAPSPNHPAAPPRPRAAPARYWATAPAPLPPRQVLRPRPHAAAPRPAAPPRARPAASPRQPRAAAAARAPPGRKKQGRHAGASSRPNCSGNVTKITSPHPARRRRA